MQRKREHDGIAIRRAHVLGVHVDSIGARELTQRILEAIRSGRQTLFSYVNVHAINLAQKNEEFRGFLERSDTVYCDGEGVRLGARMLGLRLPPRIVLTYYLWDLLHAMEEDHRSVFFLGASEDVAHRAAMLVAERFPLLKIAGSHHGYFAKDGPANDDVIDLVNRADPDLLFVGFGMPLQEHWIGRNRARLRARAILPCGSMIDYAAGTKSLAPSWMSNNGMEWLYRLAQEPGRLWFRYLVGNPLFFLNITRQWLSFARRSPSL